MTKRMLMSRELVATAIWIFTAVNLVWAGPPFATDDPEPVEYEHWEVYLASRLFHDKSGWSGTSPELEVNYGTIPNLQLHLIAPVSFVAPPHSQAIRLWGHGARGKVSILRGNGVPSTGRHVSFDRATKR